MILILGGTPEARRTAERLEAAGIPTTLSLAGSVPATTTAPGNIRIGGFGGREGLARWITEHDVTKLIDATHPFAAQMSAHAAAQNVPLLRLDRPRWTPEPGDDWTRVPTAADARPMGRRVFLAIGRQDLAPFAADAQRFYLLRAISAPDPPLPPDHHVVLDRGPFTLDNERSLLATHAIDELVTKDSGGDGARPKLEAARERGIPVIIIDRPVKPAVPTVRTVTDAVAWAAG